MDVTNMFSFAKNIDMLMLSSNHQILLMFQFFLCKYLFVLTQNSDGSQDKINRKIFVLSIAFLVEGIYYLMMILFLRNTFSCQGTESDAIIIQYVSTDPNILNHHFQAMLFGFIM